MRKNNRQDNKEMIEKLCADTWRELYRFIYYKVQNKEEAEDITQETYAKAISFINKKNKEVIIDQLKYLKMINEHHTRSMESQETKGKQGEFRGCKSRGTVHRGFYRYPKCEESDRRSHDQINKRTAIGN